MDRQKSLGDEILKLEESLEGQVTRSRKLIAIFGVAFFILGTLIALTTALVGTLSLWHHWVIFLSGLGMLALGIVILGLQTRSILKSRGDKGL